jgi:hypothetical protein
LAAAGIAFLGGGHMSAGTDAAKYVTESVQWRWELEANKSVEFSNDDLKHSFSGGSRLFVRVTNLGAQGTVQVTANVSNKTGAVSAGKSKVFYIHNTTKGVTIKSDNNSTFGTLQTMGGDNAVKNDMICEIQL